MNRGMILVGSLLCTASAGLHAVRIDRKTAALDFKYHWPAQAAAISPLDWKLRAQMTKDYRAAIATAQEDQAVAREQKRPFNRDFYWMDWSVAGEAPRLLSLRSQLSSFTGGAHPNTSYDVLLWDRRRSKEISVNDLLTAQTSLPALMRPAYCKALDAERRKRRMGETLGGEFDQCPKFSDLTIAPSDQNKNGLFDTIDFIASPYVAGPYVEGKYEISLPVTPKLIAGLKVEYRASFEAQRQ
jgi:hypothetical protein